MKAKITKFGTVSVNAEGMFVLNGFDFDFGDSGDMPEVQLMEAVIDSLRDGLMLARYEQAKLRGMPVRGGANG